MVVLHHGLMEDLVTAVLAEVLLMLYSLLKMLFKMVEKKEYLPFCVFTFTHWLHGCVLSGVNYLYFHSDKKSFHALHTLVCFVMGEDKQNMKFTGI